MAIVGAGILAVIVFGGLCIRHNVPAIEADLTDRATNELRKVRMNWATISANGRDLTLSGVAPDESARDAAMAAASVWGVRRVESALTTVVDYVMEGTDPDRPREATVNAPAASPRAPPERFRTRFTVVDGRLVLDGAAPGEEPQRDLVELAQSRFGIATVEARLQPAGDGPEGWMQAAAVALDIADHLVFGEINLVDRSLHVTGITATREGDESIRRLVAEQLPDGYSGTAETGARAELESVLRTAPSLAQRLSRRDTASPPAGVPAPRVLEPARCESEFRATQGDRRILFATGSAALTQDSLGLLDELADVLKRCSATRVAIGGHTDDQGLMENNLALSQRRAESVMQHLVSRGISLGRLTARGFGEERPLAPNETAQDRAINRRIEFVFEGG